MSKDIDVIEKKLKSHLVAKTTVVINDILNKIRPINSRGTNHDSFILWSTAGLCNHFALLTAQATDKIVLAVWSEEPGGKKPLLNGKWEIFHAAIQTDDNLIYDAVNTYSSKNEFFKEMSHQAEKNSHGSNLYLLTTTLSNFKKMNINPGYDYGFWSLSEFFDDKLTIYEYNVSSLEYDKLLMSIGYDYVLWCKSRRKQILARK